MRKKTKNIKGFVMNKKSGHPSYAYYQKNKIVSAIGFTDSENYNKPKTKLDYNINPASKKTCYAKNMIENEHCNTYKYKPEYREYRIHEKDIDKIEHIKRLDKTKKRR